jgi:N-acetylmuramoyl-L-alanine amidase
VFLCTNTRPDPLLQVKMMTRLALALLIIIVTAYTLLIYEPGIDLDAEVEHNAASEATNSDPDPYLQDDYEPALEEEKQGLQLNLAYPPMSGFTYYGENLFVFGTTQAYSQTQVTVNGEPVELFDPRTGNFLTMIEIPRGEEFPIIVEATNAQETVTVERSVIYPAAWQPMPRQPLTTHATYLTPSESQVIRVGDTLRIAFQGSPGAEAVFWIGDRSNQVAMTELATPTGPPGEGGIYIAAYTVDEKLLSEPGSVVARSITVALRKNGAEVTRTLPGKVTVIAGPTYRAIEVRKEHELKKQGWLHAMYDGHFQLFANSLGGAGYSTSVVNYLVEGTRYEAVGMAGSYYRVNPSGNQAFLIHQDMVRVLEDGGVFQPTLSTIELLESEEKISLVLSAAERFPFYIEDGKDRLAVKLYGLSIDEDLIMPAVTGQVNKLALEVNAAEGPDSYRLLVETGFEMAAFARRWVGTKLVIDIYKPPQVSAENVLKDKTIIIDPGHGGLDSGAIGPGDIHEKDVVLAMSLYLRDLLVAEGAKVIMTRSEDEFVNLYDRPERIDQYNADLLISVHVNAHAHNTRATEIHGLMVLYNFAHNEALAEIMLSTMEAETDLPAFRTWRSNIAVLRHPQIPSVLVEAGYLMHPEDNRHILQPAGQKKLAGAMKEGIKNYFLSFVE